MLIPMVPGYMPRHEKHRQDAIKNKTMLLYLLTLYMNKYTFSDKRNPIPHFFFGSEFFLLRLLVYSSLRPDVVIQRKIQKLRSWHNIPHRGILIPSIFLIHSYESGVEICSQEIPAVALNMHVAKALHCERSYNI